VYEHVVTLGLARQLQQLESDLVERVDLDDADSHEVLSRHIAVLARRALRAVPGQGISKLEGQVALTNHIASAIAAVVPRAIEQGDHLGASPDLLTAIVGRPAAPAPVVFPIRPETPLAAGALLTNGRGQPRIGTEVKAEMASADEVDLLCAFIKWHGVRLIQDPVRELIERGGRLRVITTTYMGATDQRALDRLHELGAEIRVSYETRTTRLHAKAWLFRRSTGASTAYVGSSNLSKSAMVDGLEWNVRLSQLEQAPVLDTFEATFDEYWNDPAFEAYDPERDADRLRAALAAESGAAPTDLATDITSIDVRPYGYQQEILEELAAERAVHGRRRNLVVMATGTGKTVVAGLDYRRLRDAGKVESILFVAHQKEILRQSRSVFRQVLRDGSFGELFVDGERPRHWRHVFASVQSLHQLDLDTWQPERFDMVIVDEFHHAEAPMYKRLLKALQPHVLLGLTATPERADGQDIRHWFDGRTAVELRLWEALERQLLAPFQYFGIHDDVDLTALRWKRGLGYHQTDLDNLYTGHDARARLVLNAVRNTVDVGQMRCIGFCVSIGHAQFMADRFARAGIPARALTSRDDSVGRQQAIEQLKRGELKVVFTVDLFNEGVDLPTVDTILMLRPTESATIFLQQLGRGLRLADDKACLTVLDFIGAQNGQFRFDLRYRALTGAGCHIQLDRVTKNIVLDNIRAALKMHRKNLIAELKAVGDVSLATFISETGIELEDLYRSRSGRGWTGLRQDAGFATTTGPQDAILSASIGRLLHFDDPGRLDLLRGVTTGLRPNGRAAKMLHLALWGKNVRFEDGVERLLAHPDRCRELQEIADVLSARIHRITTPVDRWGRNPLQVHARYSRDEACAAFGIEDPSTMREGVKWLPDDKADIFFVTLAKTERHYSPTTMYQDRAITPELFQWESQSTTSTASPTGQRYINHARNGSTVHLFVRESKDPDRDLGVPPYLYAGPMTYVQHSGDRPMRILWKLTHALPADVFHAARVATG
jgi:superfamily II DNA or RNA helicase/HKD family nuclease